MSDAEDLYTWGEIHGYFTFRCPMCGTRGATDTVPVCDSCGWEEQKVGREPDQ